LLCLAEKITKETAEPRVDAQSKKNDKTLLKFTAFCAEVGVDPFRTGPGTAVSFSH